MRIAIVVDMMIYGGIERVLINYLNTLDTTKYTVDLFILNKEVEKIVEEIPSWCNIIYWDMPIKRCPEKYAVIISNNIFKLMASNIVYIYEKIRSIKYNIQAMKYDRYDVAIAFSGHVNDLYIVGKKLKSDKKIAWLHGALYQYVMLSPTYEILYKEFDEKVVLCKDFEEEVYMYRPNMKRNTHKIWNPIPPYKPDKICNDKVQHLKDKYGDFIIMVARMNYPHKDHYTVIDAISYLKSEYAFDKKILFIGEGPELKKIQQYVKQKEVEELVVFEGTQQDVQNYYYAAYMLVHSSVAGEGLPTVILEAMSCGIPVLSTDSQVGPKEIIGQNEYGLLCEVKDHVDMAAKIKILYEDEVAYQNYSKKGRRRVEDFLPEKAIQKLEQLF